MNKINANIVIGLGFGDEGKGSTTHRLSSELDNPLVIRFNGGQQAGHTVIDNKGTKHVFSNFGAGTLAGAPTYWSNFCCFSVGSILNEYEVLRQKTDSIKLYIDALCPVTTHYDVLSNRLAEQKRGTDRHGSCGMGVGQTFERSNISPYKLFAQDLLFPEVVKHKLISIRQYYINKIDGFDEYDHESEDIRFVNKLNDFQALINNKTIKVVTANELFTGVGAYENLIFEGAQGVMLDMDFGFFPHVTYSNTTSKNALAFLDKQFGIDTVDVTINYISRIYNTRHGEGPGIEMEGILQLINNEEETNVFNDYQGGFRTGPLNIDLLQYALTCDRNFSSGLKKRLIITCADQVGDKVPFIKNGKLYFSEKENIADLLDSDFSFVYYSYNAQSSEWNQSISEMEKVETSQLL